MSASFTNVNTQFINWQQYPPSPAYSNIQIIDVADQTTYSLPSKGNYYFTHVGWDGSSANNFALTIPFPSTINGETFVIMFDGNSLINASGNDQTIQLIVSHPSPTGGATYNPIFSFNIQCVYTFIGVSGGGCACAS